MNAKERQMLDLLKRGREEWGYAAVKAEFEAEGTRTDELLRLIEIARKADLDLALKIGGCEAVRDIIESRQFGVEYVIAPMIETPYALSKFIQAKNKIYSADERKDTKFLFNVETEAAFRCLDDLVRRGSEPDGADGIVFGRVDYSRSIGLTGGDVNTPEVTDACVMAAKSCREWDLEFVVGGGVSRDALQVLGAIAGIYLSRFETRKVIFDAAYLCGAGDDDLDVTAVVDGLRAAVRFEMLWLQNKQEYYTSIGVEDGMRIEMLEKRWRLLEDRAVRSSGNAV